MLHDGTFSTVLKKEPVVHRLEQFTVHLYLCVSVCARDEVDDIPKIPLMFDVVLKIPLMFDDCVPKLPHPLSPSYVREIVN